PTIINSDPYGEGWIAVIEMENEDEVKDLMRADDYRKLIEEGD
ncbi:MAG: glycine cleavage system protein H, partial [Thermoplasmata archaeon]